MRRDCDRTIPAGQPALIVTNGTTTRKHRPLDRDLIAIGRAPTCDVGLTSPEVAPVHCLIFRAADGWRIRDCSGGRFATRVNGRAIHEETLHDTDVLHIGTFSFEFHLPASHATPAPGVTPVVDGVAAALVKRLQRSRRNLVRLALKKRQRAVPSEPLPPTLAELERQAQCLRGLQRDYETLLRDYESRLGDLEKAEQEVCDERAAFERECTERQTRLEKTEHDMARRQAEVESRLRVRWEECQERCRQAEQSHARFVPAMPATDAAAGAAIPPELAVLLDRRSRELNHFAHYLRRWRQQLLELEAERDAVLEKLRRQVEQQPAQENLEHSGSYERELNAYRLELEDDRRELNEQLCQLQVRQADMESAARESELQMSRERATIARERAELTRLRDEIRTTKDRDVREGGLRDRLAHIHRLKQELAASSSASAPGDKRTR